MSNLADTQQLESLGSAINRVCGLLAALAELYSPQDEKFAGGNSFAAHAVATAHGLLVDANETLVALHTSSLERAAQEAQLTVNRAALERVVKEGSAPDSPDGAAHAAENGLQQEQPEAASATSWPHYAAEPISAQENDGFAKTYRELLQRVTAVEVFAHDPDMQALPEAQKKLLPLVEGLREELNRLRRVA